MLIKEARETFAKAAKISSSGRNAYVGVICTDGSLLNLGSGPCHGSLQQYALSHRLNGGTVKYILSWAMGIRVEKDSAKNYIRWLANDSPWAEVFITKDVEDILKLGWVVDADHPHNFVASALIATRNITEMYTACVVERYPVYEEILRLGFSPAVAYIFSATFNSGFRRLYPINYMRLSSGHSPFELTYADELYYRNFLNNTPSNLKRDTFSKFNGYQGEVTSVWEAGVKSNEQFQIWLRELKPLVAVVAKDHNIFRKKVVHTYLIQNPEDLRSIIDQALERINLA